VCALITNESQAIYYLIVDSVKTPINHIRRIKKTLWGHTWLIRGIKLTKSLAEREREKERERERDP